MMSQGKSHIQTQSEKVQQWTQMKLHGNHVHIIEKLLERGELFPENEGLLLEIHDQVIATKTIKDT